MKKRGQVTIFIIIAILIVAGTSLVFIARDSLNFSNIPKGSESVYNAFFSCVEEVGDQAVFVVLAQGGTYEKDTNNSENFQIYKLAKPISQEDEERKIEKNEEFEFTKENIGKSIEAFIEDSLGYCLENIDFTRFDQEVIFDEFDIDVNVKDKYIIMNLDFPIAIEKEDSTLYLSDFTYKKNIDIGFMEEIVNEIVDESIELNSPPFDLIKSLEDEDEIYVAMNFVFEEAAIENMIYTIYFREGNYFINFDIHYDWYKK